MVLGETGKSVSRGNSTGKVGKSRQILRERDAQISNLKSQISDFRSHSPVTSKKQPIGLLDINQVIQHGNRFHPDLVEHLA